MQNDQEYKLEDIIDSIGLTETLQSLVQICHGKAEHLESNWQDAKSAKTWTKDAATIEKIISRLNN